MIDISQSRRLAARRFWSGYVQQVFETLEIDRPEMLHDVAESLAVFCEGYPAMPESALSLLMARSLCMTGDSDAAGRILCSDRTHRRYAGSWMEVLSAEYPFPELYPLFSSKVLRPMYLASAGTLWVLDFGKIRLSEADRHELILFRTVRVLIEKVSCVWKNSDGHGALGLKGIDRVTGLLSGRSSARRLQDHIGDVLDCCVRKNGWSSAPSILLLDL